MLALVPSEPPPHKYRYVLYAGDNVDSCGRSLNDELKMIVTILPSSHQQETAMVIFSCMKYENEI